MLQSMDYDVGPLTCLLILIPLAGRYPRDDVRRAHGTQGLFETMRRSPHSVICEYRLQRSCKVYIRCDVYLPICSDDGIKATSSRAVLAYHNRYLNDHCRCMSIIYITQKDVMKLKIFQIYLEQFLSLVIGACSWRGCAVSTSSLFLVVLVDRQGIRDNDQREMI